MDILIHGRGGQGAVTAAKFLATAAFHEGKEVQAFPHFGIERRGAPSSAFLRMDEKPILLRSELEKPDYAIVLDPALLDDEKVRKAKHICVNSKKARKNISNFDATSIALKIFGSNIVNTIMIAFFCLKTKLVSKKSLLEACSEIWHGDALEKNVKAITETLAKIK
jgi:pyruvate ferredoxin oxidoreductase gamma subunit